MWQQPPPQAQPCGSSHDSRHVVQGQIVRNFYSDGTKKPIGLPTRDLDLSVGASSSSGVVVPAAAAVVVPGPRVWDSGLTPASPDPMAKHQYGAVIVNMGVAVPLPGHRQAMRRLTPVDREDIRKCLVNEGCPWVSIESGHNVYGFDARCFYDPNRCRHVGWHPEIINGIVSEKQLQPMVERRAV